MAKVQIDESASGSTLRLHPGDEATLTLPETRTAGYSWKRLSPESPVYSLHDAGFVRAKAVGGTGSHRWVIAAVKKGSAEFELAYGRSWETAAGKRFAITLQVE